LLQAGWAAKYMEASKVFFYYLFKAFWPEGYVVPLQSLDPGDTVFMNICLADESRVGV